MQRFLILLCVCFNLYIPNLYAKPSQDSCDNRQCLAVIDVGSTGSRLHVYAYDTDATNTAININEIWNKKTKPGLATIDANQNTIDTYLNTLMNDAPITNMPVYFYATAGMRLLPAQKQEAYYNAVQNWFAQQSQWQLLAAKTITGKEEALYDWLSVNYQLGNLNSDEKNAVGVMDMGGASVQIVFPNKNNQTINADNEVAVDVYGKHYLLSVNSFLGLGQTEVSHQYLNTPSCFTNDYPLPNGNTGNGNAPVCANDIANLVNSVHQVNSVIAPKLAANPIDTWYVLGGLASLAGSSPMHFENNQFTLKQVMQQGDSQFCQQQWDDLKGQNPNNDYIYIGCLSSAYYYALVVDGYGIGSNQSIHMFPPEQSMDWTKGVVLKH